MLEFGEEDASEERMLLSALREFSDSCAPPMLHPTCPFAQSVGPNERGCADECVDLLARNAVSERENSISIGQGLAVSRRRATRPRNQPRSVDPIFDAGQIALEDSGRGVSVWRTASLLHRVQNEVCSMPGSKPTDGPELDELIDELTRRSIDGYEFLFEGLLNTVASGIIVCCFLSTGRREEAAADNFADLDRWKEFLLGGASSFNEVSPSIVLESARERLRVASVEELRNWRFPADRERRTVASTKAPFYMWLLNRYTTTYLGDWNLSSLEIEYRFQLGQYRPELSASVLDERRIDNDRLNAEIARRSMRPRKTISSRSLVSLHVGAAIQMLQTGRHFEAAALFEAVLYVFPTDPQALNNHGFCLIPVDPELALESLTKAAEEGMQFSAMNSANRALCLWRLGKPSAALVVAEEYWTARQMNGVAGADPSAYMWDFHDTSVLCERTDCEKYLIELSMHISDSVGEREQLAIWAERLSLFETSSSRAN